MVSTTPPIDTQDSPAPSKQATRDTYKPIRAARILGVGIATLDIINQVERYPDEDEEVRALGQRILRGGNCANTLAVLSALGHRCHWAGTLADDNGATLIRQDLAARDIDLTAAKLIPGGATPTSYITLSRASGSRTIVHHRDLPELDAADLAAVDLQAFDWVHLEGRNPGETAKLIDRIAAECPELPISVEIEKPRPGIEALFRLPDTAPSTIIVARAFAQQQGADNPEAFLERFARQCNASLMLLPWGAAGAYARSSTGECHFVAAQPPAQIIDTIAAGDVFNAGAIDALLRQKPINRVLEAANTLAGCSCGQLGIDGIVPTTTTCQSAV